MSVWFNKLAKIRLNYLLKELIEHKFIDLTWPGSIELQHRFVFRPVAVQRPKLAAGIAEQYEEMFGFAAIDFVEYFLLGIAVHHAREYTIFDGVQDDAAIGFCRWLLVQSRSYIIWVLSKYDYIWERERKVGGGREVLVREKRKQKEQSLINNWIVDASTCKQ